MLFSQEIVVHLLLYKLFPDFIKILKIGIRMYLYGRNRERACI